jgi:hypothetical protein
MDQPPVSKSAPKANETIFEGAFALQQLRLNRLQDNGRNSANKMEWTRTAGTLSKSFQELHFLS